MPYTVQWNHPWTSLTFRRAAVASQTIVTMLPSSPQVQAAYNGSQGIREALGALPREVASQTLCIDSTTLDVAVARDVAREVMAATGGQMVDAPVSGGELHCAATW